MHWTHSLQSILALAVKEFLALLRDRRSRIVLIGPPIAQLLVFGYAATFDLDNVPVAVYNEDSGGAGRELISRVTGSPHFDLVAELDRDADIAPLIDRREALLVLHLGQRFSADPGADPRRAGPLFRHHPSDPVPGR